MHLGCACIPARLKVCAKGRGTAQLVQSQWSLMSMGPEIVALMVLRVTGRSTLHPYNSVVQTKQHNSDLGSTISCKTLKDVKSQHFKSHRHQV